MKPLRVGVIGCGQIVQNGHIPAYIENPKTRLVAVCNTNKELLDKVRARIDIKSQTVLSIIKNC